MIFSAIKVCAVFPEKYKSEQEKDQYIELKTVVLHRTAGLVVEQTVSVQLVADSNPCPRIHRRGRGGGDREVEREGKETIFFSLFFASSVRMSVHGFPPGRIKIPVFSVLDR